MKKLRNNSRGAASLITVIFVSIVLTIMVLGFVRLAINEQRQSTDDDLTTRAFYAAESGLEDAKRAIRDFQAGDLTSLDLHGDSCELPKDYIGVLSAPTELDTEYTCMLVDMTPSSYEIALEEDKIKQVELRTEGGAGFTEILIEWHINADLPDGDGLSPALRAASDVSLPKEADWDDGTDNYPALLRTTLFSYGGVIERGDLGDSLTVAFLNPASGGTLNSTRIQYNGAAIGADYGIHAATCDASVANGEYVCKQLIRVDNSAASKNKVLRFQSIYTGTHIRVTLSNGANVIPFEGVQALVDVTGRAGDVYRRIETRVALESSLADLIFDSAIVSATDICKNLGVGTLPAHFRDNNCTP